MVRTPTKPTPEKATSITQRILLHGVSWLTYKRLLSELGDQRASRLAYAQGVLEITMPSDRHETHKKLLERIIETLTAVSHSSCENMSPMVCEYRVNMGYGCGGRTADFVRALVQLFQHPTCDKF
jgi:hypothetical protein